MKIDIDTNACQGHLRCVNLAPQLFDSDELGYGVVLVDGDVPAEQEGAARDALAGCPERAISTVSDAL